MRLSKLIRVLVAAMLVVACFAVFQWGIHPVLLKRKALRLCAELDKHRDPAVGEELMEILDGQELDGPTGSFVLQELMRPELRIRENYLDSGRVLVAVKRGAEFHSQRVSFTRNFRVLAGDEVLREGGARPGVAGLDYFEFSRGARADGVVTAIAESGQYSGRIQIEHAVIEGYPRRLTWKTGSSFPWNLVPEWMTYNNGRPRRTLYTCRFDLPVDVTVVSRDVVKLPLEVANGELDGQVQQTFRVAKAPAVPSGPFPQGGFGGGIPNRRIRQSASKVTGRMEVTCSRPPVALPLRARFRCEDGREYSSQVFGRLVRPERSLTMTMNDLPDVVDSLAPGHYKGELVLFTDRYLACEDPVITNVWSGRVTLPVDFTVEPPGTNQAAGSAPGKL